MKRMRSRAPALIIAAGLAASCEPRANGEANPSAEFGIFYGGQVQERQRIPFESDAARQSQGFRLELTPPPEQALEVRWELGMPGAGAFQKDSQGRRARPRRSQTGSARWRPGEKRFEQVLPFAPGDPLGLWNIRVLLGGDVVMDRPFIVYDAAARERRERQLSELDGGL